MNTSENNFHDFRYHCPKMLGISTEEFKAMFYAVGLTVTPNRQRSGVRLTDDTFIRRLTPSCSWVNLGHSSSLDVGQVFFNPASAVCRLWFVLGEPRSAEVANGIILTVSKLFDRIGWVEGLRTQEEKAEQQKVEAARMTAGLCVFCGKPLGMFQKLVGAKKHKECERHSA